MLDRTGEPCRSVWAEENNNILWDFYIVRGESTVVALAQGASEKDPAPRGRAWATEGLLGAGQHVPEHEQIGLGMTLLLGRCNVKRPLCFNKYHLTGYSSFRDSLDCLPLAAFCTLQHAVSPAA